MQINLNFQSQILLKTLTAINNWQGQNAPKMEEIYEKKYHDIERNHFWFRARRKYILQLFDEIPRDASILDIGCSSGILLNELASIGFEADNLFGIDLSEEAIRRCKENGVGNVFLMDAQSIELDKKFDALIASDCLEHIKEDVKALENWCKLLKPGGRLFVFVPAFNILWNEHDRVNMHFRRYTKKKLQRIVLNSGFEISKSSYWNFFLLIPILIIRLSGKLLPARKNTHTGDLEKVPSFNNWFYKLLKFENQLLKFVNLPFGVSTFCIACPARSDNP